MGFYHPYAADIVSTVGNMMTKAGATTQVGQPKRSERPERPERSSRIAEDFSDPTEERCLT